MATIGFSMLVTFLVISNITHKMTIALLIGAVVIFCCFLIFKSLRKYLSVVFALIGVITFTLSFVGAEKYYLGEVKEFENEQTLTGLVCETPTDSDYAFTYIIKPNGKNYKIRFVSDEDNYLEEGDCVKLVGKRAEVYETSDFFENSLSSKVYFTFFGSDGCNLYKTGEVDWYYKNVGAIKRGFVEVITQYLPGRNGAIATAMTIGDKSELDRKVINNFNYCGTSHLLVISGLHITLWSLGIIRFLYKFPKLRRKAPFIGIFTLLIYASITGFSVSVIRAGAMVGAVLLAKLFNRDADSINSIGLALVFILLVNPFAAFSAALWLSFLSTLAMLVYSGKIKAWINEKTKGKAIFEKPLFDLISTTVSISFSTAIFTLPVFIFKLRMLSVVSVLTNFLMVDLAMIMMVCTVGGVVFHCLYMKPFAHLCFMISGVIGEFLHFVAEKIGVAEWSTISLSHKYYEYFFILLIVGVLAVFITEKYKIHIIKHTTTVLIVVFVILATYCTMYDYNNVSVEIAATENNPIVMVNYNGKSILIGTQKKKYIDEMTNVLNKYNKKHPDVLVVIEKENRTVSEIINFYDNFGITDTYFRNKAPQIFEENAKSNVSSLKINNNVSVDLTGDNIIKITSKGKNVIITDYQNTENLFENIKECDIIIVYGKNSEKLSETEKAFQVISLKESEKISLCL